MRKIKYGNGYYEFKLEDILEKREVTLNRVLIKTETDFNVLNRIKTGNLTRMDLSVLARLCDFLDCDLTDIIEYKKDNKRTND